MAKKEEGFEKRLVRLKEIVEALERGDLPLEQGVALYKEGLTLARACGKQLEAARNEVKVAGEGALRDFNVPEDGNGDDDQA
ncbi:exodeoxyribonuclease VII small subunit [Desulfovibrio aminophilus]|jgi:Exodeoxyribonuclease VII small subunit (EC 3.1.11.6)|uniref:exodeoxyribonuclease VII small subunit n=1 Tax=Desulfovibrio aminophilus TaxID=81425 RepID=UPI003392A87E